MRQRIGNHRYCIEKVIYTALMIHPNDKGVQAETICYDILNCRSIFNTYYALSDVFKETLLLCKISDMTIVGDITSVPIMQLEHTKCL